MCEIEELICELNLDCLLVDQECIKFRVYPTDGYQNDQVVEATLEMFYAWSKYVYENSDIIRGGRLANKDLLEIKIQKA